MPLATAALGQAISADTALIARLAQTQQRRGEAVEASRVASRMGDYVRAAQAKALVELQADELQQARLQYEYNQAESDAARRFYQETMSVATCC